MAEIMLASTAVDVVASNADEIMIGIGVLFFGLSYVVSAKIADPPNNNLWYLLGPGHYVDAATGEYNQQQMRELSHTQTIGDKISNALADTFGRNNQPVLRTDPKDGGLKYFINGSYYTIDEVKKDIDGRKIPDAWGADVDIGALRAEISQMHIDASGAPILIPSEVPKATNVNAYNNMTKAEQTANKGPLLSEGAAEFVAANPSLISQAYPGRDVQSLTDDDIVHVYNQIYVGAADRRHTIDGEATRVDIAKWVNLKHQAPTRLAQYTDAIIRNNQKWKAQVDKGRVGEGLKNQLSQKPQAAVASMPISNKRKN